MVDALIKKRKQTNGNVWYVIKFSLQHLFDSSMQNYGISIANALKITVLH